MNSASREVSEQELLAVAIRARDRAHAIYSRFPVGAALESERGEIIPGCNLENASLGLGICAERVALFALLGRGLRPGRRLVIATRAPDPTPPCGACRDVIAELAPQIEVISVASNGRQLRWHAGDLLPDALPVAGRQAYDPRSVIARKRDGEELGAEEIRALLRGLLEGQVADYQMTAFMMATCLRGMTVRETRDLTRTMLDSGQRLRWDEVPGPKVDKHSTGGVGDKVSIPLLPICLAAGLTVPMLSGRGLGDTGGTLDKLDSIPGYRSRVPIERLRELIREQGGFIAGQTNELVPADRIMYALRDVSATIESVPLIVGSILSKKLSAGVTALALDVKLGRGAFMRGREQAADLAQNLVSVAHDLGLPAVALLTRMDAPLGAAVGNALEIHESMQLLRGDPVRPDLLELTLTFAGLLWALANPGHPLSEGARQVRELIASGAAARAAERWIEAQGGDPRVVTASDLPAVSSNRRTVESQVDGFVCDIDARRAGRLCTLLGGGRLRSEDRIDPSVGIWFHVRPGEAVRRGQPLYTLYLAAGAASEQPYADEQAMLTLAEEPPGDRPLIEAMVARSGGEVGVFPFDCGRTSPGGAGIEF